MVKDSGTAHDVALIAWRFYRRYLFFVGFFAVALALASIGDAVRLFATHPLISVFVISIALWIAAGVVYRRRGKFYFSGARHWALRIWAGE